MAGTNCFFDQKCPPPTCFFESQKSPCELVQLSGIKYLFALHFAACYLAFMSAQKMLAYIRGVLERSNEPHQAVVGAIAFVDALVEQIDGKSKEIQPPEEKADGTQALPA